MEGCESPSKSTRSSPSLNHWCDLGDVFFAHLQGQGMRMLPADAPERFESRPVKEAVDSVGTEKRVLIPLSQLVPVLFYQYRSFGIAILHKEIDHLTVAADYQVVPLVQQAFEYSSEGRHEQLTVRKPAFHKGRERFAGIQPNGKPVAEDCFRVEPFGAKAFSESPPVRLCGDDDD